MLCLDMRRDIASAYALDCRRQNLQLIGVLGKCEDSTCQSFRLLAGFLRCRVEKRLDFRICEQALVHARRDFDAVFLQRWRRRLDDGDRLGESGPVTIVSSHIKAVRPTQGIKTMQAIARAMQSPFNFNIYRDTIN